MSIEPTVGARVTIDAASSSTFEVSTEVLNEHLVSLKGSTQFSLVNVDETTITRRSELLTISVQSPVLTSSFVDFEAAVQAIVSSKVELTGA